MSDPSELLVTQLLQTFGTAGAVLAVGIYAIRTLHTQLTDVQERRIAEAQATTVRLLEFVAKQHEHQALLAAAIDGNADAIQSLRELVASLTVAQRGALPPGRPR